MRKEYFAPQIEEILYVADAAISTIPPSATNDGEFEDWT